MSGSIYKIGVEINLADNMSRVLAVLAKNVLALGLPISQIEKAFGGWNIALRSVGGILGGEILESLGKVAQSGEKLLDQQDKLQRANLSLNDVLAIQKNYYDRVAQAVPTSTASEYLRTVNELRAVTGSVAGAEALAPKALMTDALLSNTFGREMHGEYYKLLRSAEMKGISTDPEKLNKFTEQFFSYITAFGGKLTADDVQTLARRGGTSFMNAKPEALGPLAVLAADLGGSGAGTTSMTLQQLQMGATTLSKQQAAALSSMGLLDMTKATATGFGGSRLQLAPGAMTGSLEYAGNQPGWIKDVVYPALVKASHGDEGLLESLIAKISPNRNAAKLIEMYGNPRFLDQQAKDLGMAGPIEDVGIMKNYTNGFMARNPMGVEKGFSDQFHSMMEAIGSPMLLAALPVMRQVTALFTSLGQIANEHPEAMKYIGEAVAAIGAALAGIGLVAVGSLIGIPAALTAITLAFGGMALLHWDAVRSGLLSVSKALDDFIKWMEAIPGRIGSLFGDGGQFKKNLDDANRNYVPMRFTPGAGHRAPPITLALNVDGRTLAQTISNELANLMTFPTGAASPDHYAQWGDADGGTTTG